MSIKKIILLLIFLSLSTVSAKMSLQKDDEDVISNEQSKLIIGTVETVYVEPGELFLQARIDTGANTTSLDAQDMQIITEDDVPYVIFKVNGKEVKARILKFVRIKQHGSASQRRPVIMMSVTLANVTQTIKVTLTDRSNFKYKMLIGVNFLYDNFLVDVSQRELTKPQKAVK